MSRTALAPRPTTRKPQPRLEGITLPDPRAHALQKRVTVLLTVLPFAGFVTAIWTLWGRGLSAVDLGILVGSYAFTCLGITVGYHRLFTHRSFEATPGTRVALAVAGSMAVEGSVISWVATHRRHHAYSDVTGDPHSPHLTEDPGIKGVLKGLWHAHLGWLFDAEKTSAERWAPDLLKEDRMKAIDRAFPWLVLVTFMLPGFAGFALTRSWQGALSALLWGGVVRVFLLHHVTWSINSICHFYGKRPYETRDESRNNWLISIVSFGESWHNNHHAFPSSARLGIDRGQIDLGSGLITLLERRGLARDVREPSREQRDAKRRR